MDTQGNSLGEDDLSEQASEADDSDVLTQGELEAAAAKESYTVGRSCKLSPHWEVKISANWYGEPNPHGIGYAYLNYIVINSPGRLKGIRVNITGTPRTYGARTEPDSNGRYIQRIDPDVSAILPEVSVVAPSGAICTVIL